LGEAAEHDAIRGDTGGDFVVDQLVEVGGGAGDAWFIFAALNC
jgi:hypothetical protein